MGTLDFLRATVLSFFILHSYFIDHHVASSNHTAYENGRAREALLSPSPSTPAALSPPSPSPVLPLLALSSRIRSALRAIQAFKRLIRDDPLRVTDSWRGNDVCSNYKGFKCARYPTDNKLAVYGVSFNGFRFAGFNGSLPVDVLINGIPELSYFHANSNNFTGTVPRSILNLPYLFELDLSNNKLSGNFPASVLAAANLTFVDLRFNSFVGNVPRGLFTLDLDYLFVNNNQFGVQRLPVTIGTPRALFITLANSRFVGSIPGSIGGAGTRLLEILLLNNRLSGCLPTGIGSLGLARLFDASQNRLTGPIPRSLACMRGMQELSLANNQMYGGVPEELCRLPLLSKLSLAFNFLTQVGPYCRNLINRRVLDVRMNCIAGLPNQRPSAVCARFFSVPRRCPRESYLRTHLPCRIGAEEANTTRQETSTTAFRPVSYGVLNPHRNL